MATDLVFHESSHVAGMVATLRGGDEGTGSADGDGDGGEAARA